MRAASYFDPRTRIPIRAGMDLPSLEGGHRVHALLSTRLRPESVVTRTHAPHAHWSAEYFKLVDVGLFRGATNEQKWKILDLCGRGLLEEAYFIEKSGIAFAAQMILLSESIEERMLYAVFAAEEARHFDSLRPFVEAPPDAPSGPFLALLKDVIECGDRAALQFIVQVILEGWGLSHYRTLRDGCGTPALYHRLDAILHDEAAHHGSGKVLFGEANVSEGTLEYIEVVLAAMLAMVRAGPVAVVAAIDETLGGVSPSQRSEVLRELGRAEHARNRLEHLKQLVRFETVRSVVERLESKGLFAAPEEP